MNHHTLRKGIDLAGKIDERRSRVNKVGNANLMSVVLKGVLEGERTDVVLNGDEAEAVKEMIVNRLNKEIADLEKEFEAL